MAFWNNPSELTPKQSHRWVISFGEHDIQKTDSSATRNIIPFYFAKSIDKPSYEIGIQQAKYLYSHTFNFPKRLTWKPITITFYDVIAEKTNTSFLFKPTVSTIGELNSVITQSDAIRTNETISITEADIYAKNSTQLFFYKFLQESGYFDPEEYNKEDQLLRFRKYNFKKDMIKALVGQQADFWGNVKSFPVDTDLWKTLNIIELNPNGKPIETWKLYAPLVTDVKFDRLDYSNENVLSVTVTINYDWAKLQPEKIYKNFKTYDIQQAKGVSGLPTVIGVESSIGINEDK